VSGEARGTLICRPAGPDDRASRSSRYPLMIKNFGWYE
jgi:hypothetical protein